MRISLAGAVAALGLLAAGAPAQAATVVLELTLDLATPQDAGCCFTAGWRGFGSFSPESSFSLEAGDTLDYTIRFGAGQTLTLIDPTFFWAFWYGDASSDVNATGSLELLDADGAVLFATTAKTDDEGSAHFGQQFSDGDFGGLPSSVTFAGLRYVGTLNSYAEPDVTTRLYYDPQVLFSAGEAQVGVGTVPEPAAWALMVVGFAGLGAGLRRRRRTAAALA
ncbi:PEP-CTERM sorting domain-containing protein [Phenylobacterium sp.]|uniref:PEP-CTERM sorting domain-containing protein n=1 Tax=Phenylobacterium sp. TaxID=1871053 RepID=UPI0025EA5081|nr:PEP-CTERM sorting domain-containing protein [Phenylobacterium sp.]MBX3486246.1 PEP-CTERM sorting domain-containing protein [Phenylobacterium sp.]MCW5761282.1 PEP-CTERM sorting domain-containing protein [Phenylobacterium sp.]